jgi:hypothetical protein
VALTTGTQEMALIVGAMVQILAESDIFFCEN